MGVATRMGCSRIEDVGSEPTIRVGARNSFGRSSVLSVEVGVRGRRKRKGYK